jgi:hypothetical protein
MTAYNAADLWTFLPGGYLFTIALETPVLFVGLSAAHSSARRLFAGVWLTACTYPIVVLVLPLLLVETYGYGVYLAVAETFAPAAECLLFWLAFRGEGQKQGLGEEAWLRDFAAITAANLTSFLVGLALLG